MCELDHIYQNGDPINQLWKRDIYFRAHGEASTQPLSELLVHQGLNVCTKELSEAKCAYFPLKINFSRLGICPESKLFNPYATYLYIFLSHNQIILTCATSCGSKASVCTTLFAIRSTTQLSNSKCLKFLTALGKTAFWMSFQYYKIILCLNEHKIKMKSDSEMILPLAFTP